MANVSVTLGLKNAGFRRGLDDARGQVRSFKKEVESGGGLFGSLGKGFAALSSGLAAGFGLAAFKSQVLDTAGALTDQADAVGMTAEAMQRLQEAFAPAGADAEKVTNGLLNLQQKMSDAIGGNERAIESFDKLGVSMTDLVENANNPEEVIFKLADGFAAAADRGEALSGVMDILGGKAAKKMATGMAAGGDSLRKAFKEAFAITNEEANALDRASDGLDKFGRDARKTAQAVTAGLMGKGRRFSLEEDPAVREQKAAAEEARQRRREKMDNEKEIAHRLARAPDAATTLSNEQKTQRTIEAAASGASSRTAALSIRRRIAELAPLAIGPSADAAQNRAELAGLMSDRLDQLKARSLMTPNERREADRQARRDERAMNKAQRQLDREVGPDIRKQATATTKDLAADAVKEAKGVLDQIYTAVSKLSSEKPIE